jgi:hypothetical protein
LAFSYWIDNLGFITEGNLAAIFIKPSLGVSNWPVILLYQQTESSFLASSSPRHQGALGRGGDFLDAIVSMELTPSMERDGGAAPAFLQWLGQTSGGRATHQQIAWHRAQQGA